MVRGIKKNTWRTPQHGYGGRQNSSKQATCLKKIDIKNKYLGEIKHNDFRPRGIVQRADGLRF